MRQIPVHVILLYSDEKRIQHVENNVKNNINSVNILKAVSDKNEINKCIKKFSITIDSKYKKTCTIGQLGCTFSHMLLWKNMVDNNIKEMIVLEDDVEIPSDYEDKIKNIVNELPEDYDFLYLFVHPVIIKNMESVENQKYTIPGKKLIVKGYKTWGTVGYLLTLKTAKMLLENFKNLRTNVDTQITGIIHEYKVFSVRDKFLSTVGQLRSKKKSKELKSNVWGTAKMFGTSVKTPIKPITIEKEIKKILKPPIIKLITMKSIKKSLTND